MEDNLKKCIELLKLGKDKELYELTKTLIKETPENVEFLKLHGIALANLNSPLEAREAFLRVLQIKPDDSNTVANYVTACLHDCDGQSAIKTLELHLKFLKGFDRENVALALMEGAKNKVFSFKDVSDEIVSFVNKELNISYVNSKGDPMSLKDIDFSNMEFADKDDNPVDPLGNPMELVFESFDYTIVDTIKYKLNNSADEIPTILDDYYDDFTENDFEDLAPELKNALSRKVLNFDDLSERIKSKFEKYIKINGNYVESININGAVIHFRDSSFDFSGGGHGYSLQINNSGFFAFIDGYRFTPGKSITIYIADENFPGWEEDNLNAEEERKKIKSLMIELAKDLANDKNEVIGFPRRILCEGYVLLGGF